MSELDATAKLSTEAKPPTKRVAIFRAADARDIAQTDMNKPSPPPPAEREPLSALLNEGRECGTTVRVLCQAGGLSLVYAWFKSLYPLPAHSHDTDCVYYIISGQLTLGTQTLGVGDSVFVPANVFYSFAPGPEGVELLEFRAANAFDTVIRAGTPAMWERAASVVRERLPLWKSEVVPSQRHNATT